ncbi:MAG: hypothetical protein J6A28_00405 [Clostridia bacterium]|nr:hypothetical protein [Clostridia bacterium]
MKKSTKVVAGTLVAALAIGGGLGMAACHQHAYDHDFDTLCDCGYEREIENLDTWDGEIGLTPIDFDGDIFISSAEQLASLAREVSEGNDFEGCTISLTCNIDLQNKEWTPIGYGSSHYSGVVEAGKPFKGTFDGQGHTIANLNISQFYLGGIEGGASSGVALFGHVFGATIKNLNVVGANVVGNHYVAVITGHAVNSHIENCHVYNANVNSVYDNDDESGDKAGVISAHIAKGIYEGDSASVKNCSATDCTVKADRDAGQIIGCLSNGAQSTGNIANNVVVSWNESGSTQGKSNTNIKNEIYGRLHN